MISESSYKGKRVLITGHTGFKGSWLSLMLSMLGAEVYGYALEPSGKDALYTIIRGDSFVHSEIGDIRDFDHLRDYFERAEPEFVFHLAAQPIVRESYRIPRETYETNVMGTVNVCECVRRGGSVRSFLNVTTDKVYRNHEWEWGYRETDELDGDDPYSNSKSCSELVTHSYRRSFFEERGIACSTARAGNVIGGGDFASDRIIPDCYRAAVKRKNIVLRNPNSIRPFQHVLEPLWAYILIAGKQCEDPSFAGCYNVGPADSDHVTVKELADMFCGSWQEGMSCETEGKIGPHEASFLKLDHSRIKQRLGWMPRWGIRNAIEKTVEWYKLYEKCRGLNTMPAQMRELMEKQITDYMEAGS